MGITDVSREIRLYFQTLTSMLGQPRRYFTERRENDVLVRGIRFMLISAVFYAVASSVIQAPSQPLSTATVSFINAVSMPLIGAALAFMSMRLIYGRRTAFRGVVSIFALASGVTLLFSWVPYFVWLTEPWKWWLIGTGLTRSCHLRWHQALLVVVLTLFLVTVLFWSLFAVVISE